VKTISFQMFRLEDGDAFVVRSLNDARHG